MIRAFRWIAGIFAVIGVALSVIALTQAWSDSPGPWGRLGLLCVSLSVACIALGINAQRRRAGK